MDKLISHKKRKMKYKFACTVIAILTIANSMAQFSTASQKAIGGYDSDEMMKMIKTKDGGLIAGGGSYSNAGGQKSQDSRGGRDYWIIKYDKNGAIQWDKTIGGNSEDNLTAIIQTSDGGYALIGTSSSDISGEKTQNSRGGLDWWLVKLDANGNIKWDKTIGGSGNEYIDYVIQAGDGSYILAGSSDSPISGEKTENSRGVTDYWVVKLDRNGNKYWDKTLGGADYEWCSPFQITKDGGLIVGGFSSSNAGFEKSENSRGFFGSYDYWVVKLDKRGKIEWDKTLGGMGDEFSHTIYQNPNGEYVIGGSSNSNISGEKSENSRGGFDYWLVKLDKNGKKTWDKTAGGDGEDFFAVFEVTNQGDYLIAGSSNSNLSGEKSEGCRSGGFGPTDYWVVKMEECGKVKWDKTVGGTSDDRIVNIIDNGNDHYLLGGSSWSFISGDKTQMPVGSQDFWIVDLSIGKFGIPTINTQKTIGGYADDILKAEGADLTRDGGWIIGASSASDIGFEKTGYNRGNFDYWVVKYDRYHNIEWEKTIGGSDYDELMSIHQTFDGGYILAGNSSSNQSGERSENSRGGFDIWIVKLDKFGNIQWDKSLGGSDNEFVSSIIQLRDGGYLVGGYSASNVSGEKSENSKGGYDMWTIKIDNTGHVLWDKTIGGSDNEFNNYLQLTSDGGYVSAGISFSDQSFDKSENKKGGFDFWIVRFDRFGHKKWDKTIGGGADDFLNGIQVSGDENFFVAGASLSNISGDKTENSRGGADYWVVKLDKLGKIQWDKTIGGSSDEYANDLIATRDNGVALAGVSNSSIGGEKSEYNRGDFDYWVVKLDGKGKIEWDKTLGGFGGDLLYDIQEIGDEHFLLSGFSWSWLAVDKAEYQHGGLDLWLIDFEMDKEKNHECHPGHDEDTKLITSEATESRSPDFAAFPNPARNVLNVISSQMTTISLSDQSGKKIFEKKIIGNTQINVSHLAPGVYYLKNNSTGVIHKVIIAK